MKKLLALVGILLLVAVLAPGLLGHAAERSARAQLERDVPLASLLEVRLRSYERGWFGSRALLVLGLAEDLRNPSRPGGRGSDR